MFTSSRAEWTAATELFSLDRKSLNGTSSSLWLKKTLLKYLFFQGHGLKCCPPVLSVGTGDRWSKTKEIKEMHYCCKTQWTKYKSKTSEAIHLRSELTEKTHFPDKSYPNCLNALNSERDYYDVKSRTKCSSRRLVTSTCHLVLSTCYLVVSTRRIVVSARRIVVSTRLIVTSTCRPVMSSSLLVVLTRHLLGSAGRLFVSSFQLVVSSCQLVTASLQTCQLFISSSRHGTSRHFEY